MAPYSSTRDPFSVSQVHPRSAYTDSTRQHHRSSGSLSLVSPSIRAKSSPRLVHGKSPLLNAFNMTPTSEETEDFSSPGQFSDAEMEEGSTSPSSRALQDELQSATRALEELKEAVRVRRTKRLSLSSRDLEMRKQPCLGTKRECLSNSAGLGLGLHLDNLQPQVENSPLVAHFEAPALRRTLSELPSLRRHWSVDVKDCNTTSSARLGQSTMTDDKQVFSPQTVASPTLMTTAPPTPSLESSAFTTMETPIMPSSTFSAGNTTEQQGQDGSSFFSSAQEGNHATAIASIGAAGSLLILAALLIAVYFRKQRSRRYKNQMESVLEKVAPLPPPSERGDNEKQEGGAVGSNDFFAGSAKTETPRQNAEEYRTVPPWLSLNMETHPFASVSTKAERFSHDLADSGVVGLQAPSKDYSFNWNFPRLSVPPAAARAISTGHYVKRRATVVPRTNSKGIEAQIKPIQSYPSASRSCSSIQDFTNMSQSASSECIDPEIDHRRKSFTILQATSRPLVWIKSAFRQLTPNQQQNRQHARDIEHIDTSSVSSPWVPSISSRQSISQSIDDRSLSLSMQKSTTSFTHFVPDSYAITQAVVQQVLEIRLPSLSIANSPMLDIKEIALPLSSTKQVARMPSWSSSKTPPQRSFSSGSDGTSNTKCPQLDRDSRRVSWAGPLESCREDSKESFLDALRSTELTSKVVDIRRSRVWHANDLTDTEDDTTEGYEAEGEEMDTEVEIDKYMPSTPVITLTCSEEEGQFERRISMSSVSQGASSSDDHAKQEGQHKLVAKEDSSDDDDGATIIVHSDQDEDDSDSCHSYALHSLLVDDFPTIPEWTPIATPLRNTIK